MFQLFDKDEDGVLSFPELNVVMRALGQRPSGKGGIWRTPIICSVTETNLLKMVRTVSEDKLHDTIEFNEFLQMMSKQEEEEITEESLIEAFK